MLSDEEFSRLAKLCRFALTEDEKKKLLQNLQNILGYIESLQEIETTGIAPCVDIITTHTLPLRSDEEGPLLTREEFLANSPNHIGGMVKVPPIIELEE